MQRLFLFAKTSDCFCKILICRIIICYVFLDMTKYLIIRFNITYNQSSGLTFSNRYQSLYIGLAACSSPHCWQSISYCSYLESRLNLIQDIVLIEMICSLYHIKLKTHLAQQDTNHIIVAICQLAEFCTRRPNKMKLYVLSISS